MEPKKQSRLTSLIVVVVILAIAVLAYLIQLKSANEVTMVKVIAINPNYSTVQIPQNTCKDVTTTKMVKNKNSNFFSNLFDSKSHPKYVAEKDSKHVCQTVDVESQIINNYTIKYQVKDFIESMQVQTPPPLNVEMPLTELQRYVKIESATAPTKASGGQ